MTSLCVQCARLLCVRILFYVYLRDLLFTVYYGISANRRVVAPLKVDLSTLIYLAEHFIFIATRLAEKFHPRVAFGSR